MKNIWNIDESDYLFKTFQTRGLNVKENKTKEEKVPGSE